MPGDARGKVMPRGGAPAPVDAKKGGAVTGRLLQVSAIIAALLLAIWLLVTVGVARTYDVSLMNRSGAFFLWGMFWVPFHLLAAGFLAGRLMSRSSSGRIRSSDKSR